MREEKQEEKDEEEEMSLFPNALDSLIKQEGVFCYFGCCLPFKLYSMRFSLFEQVFSCAVFSICKPLLAFHIENKL